MLLVIEVRRLACKDELVVLKYKDTGACGMTTSRNLFHSNCKTKATNLFLDMENRHQQSVSKNKFAGICHCSQIRSFVRIERYKH